jgi:hypothetical protein
VTRDEEWRPGGRAVTWPAVRASTLLAVAVLLAVPSTSRAADSLEARGDARGDGRGDARPRGFARPIYGFRLGAVTPTSSASPDTLTAIGGGGYVLFDIPDLLADLSIDVFAGESRARMIAGGIGAYAVLADGETVPYVGGGMKIGWTRFGGDGATGLLPYGTIGLLVGRSWSPQIRAEISWFFQTGTERRDPNGSTHHSTGPIFTVGMGF